MREDYRKACHERLARDDGVLPAPRRSRQGSRVILYHKDAALSNLAPEVTSGWVRAFADNDIAAVSDYQKKINTLMDIYVIRNPFLPVLKEAVRLRGYASSSAGTFPMPSATVGDDAKILEILHRAGVK